MRIERKAMRVRLTDAQERKLAREICNCSECEQKKNCKYKGKYYRFPRELMLGALGLCPKIRNMRR